MTTKNEETERLIKEIKAFRQQHLEAAYGLGTGLLIIKEHEPRVTFVEILQNEFGLTEIEGEAICKNMRLYEKPEAAAKIVEIMLNASMRMLEKLERDNPDG
jgi:hypothetical protein